MTDQSIYSHTIKFSKHIASTAFEIGKQIRRKHMHNTVLLYALCKCNFSGTPKNLNLHFRKIWIPKDSCDTCHIAHKIVGFKQMSYFSRMVAHITEALRSFLPSEDSFLFLPLKLSHSASFACDSCSLKLLCSSVFSISGITSPLKTNSVKYDCLNYKSINN